MPWDRKKLHPYVENQSMGVQDTFHKAFNLSIKEGLTKKQASEVAKKVVREKYKKKGSKWVAKRLADAVIDKKKSEGQPQISEIKVEKLPKEAFILNRAKKRASWKYPFQFLNAKGVLEIHAEMLENAYRLALKESASPSTIKRIQHFRRELGMVERKAHRRSRPKGAIAEAFKKAHIEKSAAFRKLVVVSSKRAKKFGIVVKEKGNCLSPPKGKSSAELWMDPVNYVGLIDNSSSILKTEKAFKEESFGVVYSKDEKIVLWGRIVEAKKNANMPHVYDPAFNPFDKYLSGDSEEYAKTCEEIIDVDMDFSVDFPFVLNEDGGIKKFTKEVDGEQRVLLVGEATNTIIDKEDERITVAFMKKIKAQTKEVRMPFFYEHQRKIEFAMGYIDSNETKITFDKGKGVARLRVGAIVEDPEKDQYTAMTMRKIKHGIPLGISIGGRLIAVKRQYDKELDRIITDLGDGIIWEMSATAMPAINDSSPLVAMMKSVGEQKYVLDTIQEVKTVIKEMLSVRDSSSRIRGFLGEKIKQLKESNVPIGEKKAQLWDIIDSLHSELSTEIDDVLKEFLSNFMVKLEKQ